MEQTSTQLSARSRMTSISNSFQPSSDSSMSTSLDRREVQPARDDGLEFLLVVRDAAALAAERERRADDERETARPAGRFRAPRRESCATPERATSRPILSMASLKSWRSSPFSMAVGVRADELDAVFLQDAGVHEVHRGVERGLAAEGGQEGVGSLGGDDFFDDLDGDRLDVGARGELRVGHDRGRVGVEQDDLVTFLRERLAGLDAGIVELAALPDDDGAAAEQEDFLEVGIFGHGGTGKVSHLKPNAPETPRLKRENRRHRASRPRATTQCGSRVFLLMRRFPRRNFASFQKWRCLQ